MRVNEAAARTRRRFSQSELLKASFSLVVPQFALHAHKRCVDFSPETVRVESRICAFPVLEPSEGQPWTR